MNTKVEGWHLVSFESNLGMNGSGLVHVAGEWLSGEDATYRYRGRVSTKGGLAKGRVVVTRKSPNGISIFGKVEQFVLVITGNCATGKWFYSGHVLGAEHLRLRFTLARVIEVPLVS